MSTSPITAWQVQKILTTTDRRTSRFDSQLSIKSYLDILIGYHSIKMHPIDCEEQCLLHKRAIVM